MNICNSITQSSNSSPVDANDDSVNCSVVQGNTVVAVEVDDRKNGAKHIWSLDKVLIISFY